MHLKASFGNPVACPKPRPLPSARGAYASYPSLTTSWGKQAEGCDQPKAAHMSRRGLVWIHLLHYRRRLGSWELRLDRRSGPFLLFQIPARVRANKVIKHSDVHSQHWTRALPLWCELCELTSGMLATFAGHFT